MTGFNGSDTLEKVMPFLYNEAKTGLALEIGSNLGRLVMRKGSRGYSHGQWARWQRNRQWIHAVRNKCFCPIAGYLVESRYNHKRICTGCRDICGYI